MRRAIDDMRATGGNVGVPSLLCILAQAQLATRRLEDARASLAEAAGLVACNGNALNAAERMRLEGELAQS